MKHQTTSLQELQSRDRPVNMCYLYADSEMCNIVDY